MFSQTADNSCLLEFEGNTANPSCTDPPSTQPPTLDGLEPLVLNVYFWKVNDPNGNYGGINFSEDKFLEAIASANRMYNASNIFFKYRGYEDIDSPSNVYLEPYLDTDFDSIPDTCVLQPQLDPEGYGNISRCQRLRFYPWISNQNHIKQDAINVYVPYKLTGFGGSGIYGGNRNIVSIGKLNETNFLHELGHNVGLLHTRTENGSEHATRDIYLPDGVTLNPDFNAHCKGDQIIDTAANRGFWKPGTDHYPFVDEENCVYEGGEFDNIGQPYDITYEDLINVMGDAYDCTQRYLTIEQGAFIHNFVRNDATFIPIIQSPEVLFEPYKGEYSDTSPVTSLAYFQPGFDYDFVECVGPYPEPAIYNEMFYFYRNNVIHTASADEDDYNLIYHPNHSAIMIQQLQQPSGPAPQLIRDAQKCYDISSFWAANGSLTKFNDNVFNGNVTITPMDSTTINNPQMVENLEPGLYVVDKNYEDGTTQQNVILKENE